MYIMYEQTEEAISQTLEKLHYFCHTKRFMNAWVSRKEANNNKNLSEDSFSV